MSRLKLSGLLIFVLSLLLMSQVSMAQDGEGDEYLIQYEERNIFLTEDLGESRTADPDSRIEDSVMLNKDTDDSLYLHIGYETLPEGANSLGLDGVPDAEPSSIEYELTVSSVNNNDNIDIGVGKPSEYQHKAVFEISNSEYSQLNLGEYQTRSINSVDDQQDVGYLFTGPESTRLRVVNNPDIGNQLNQEYRVFWHSLARIDRHVFPWEAATLAAVPRGDSTSPCYGSCAPDGGRQAGMHGDQGQYIPMKENQIEIPFLESPIPAEPDYWPSFEPHTTIGKVISETRDKAVENSWNRGTYNINGDIIKSPDKAYNQWKSDAESQLGFCEEDQESDVEDCSWLALNPTTSRFGRYHMTPQGELIEYTRDPGSLSMTPFIRTHPEEALSYSNEYLEDGNKLDTEDFCYGDSNSYAEAKYVPPEYNKLVDGQPVKVYEERQIEGVNLALHYSAMKDYECPGWVDTGLSDLDPELPTDQKLSSETNNPEENPYCPDYLTESQCSSYMEEAICSRLGSGSNVGPCGDEEIKVREGTVIGEGEGEGRDQDPGSEADTPDYKQYCSNRFDVGVNDFSSTQTVSCLLGRGIDGNNIQEAPNCAGNQNRDTEVGSYTCSNLIRSYCGDRFFMRYNSERNNCQPYNPITGESIGRYG